MKLLPIFSAAVVLFQLPLAMADISLSKPHWVVPPLGNSATSELPGNFAKRQNVSNNNVAIIRHGDWLYMAYRSASHHHPGLPQTSLIWNLLPKPPLYLKQEDGTSINVPARSSEAEKDVSRMFVIRANFQEAVAAQESGAQINWEPVAEMSESLQSVLEPHFNAWIAAYKTRNTSAQANERAYFQSVYGDDEIKSLDKTAKCMSKKIRILCGTQHEEKVFWRSDFREPIFTSINGNLGLLFVQVEKKAMTFNTLRTWSVKLDASKGYQVVAPTPALRPKEQAWEVQKIKLADQSETLLLESYRGTHYGESDTGDATQVSLWQSSGDNAWNYYSEVYVGGGNEMGFTQRPDQPNELWGVIRHDDGDEKRGWGSLVVHSEDYGKTWILPDRAIPTCYDSSRMIALNGKIYLFGRKNVLWNDDGTVDESVNAPYDVSFQHVSYEEGLQTREGLLTSIQNGELKNKKGDVWAALKLFSVVELHARFSWNSIKTMGVFNYFQAVNYWIRNSKRTAVYELDPSTGKISLLDTLPSAGDTSFATFAQIDDGSTLVANYTSDYERSDSFRWSWQQAQYQPTGIYLTKFKVK